MSVPAFDDPNVFYSYFLRSQVSSYLVLHLTMDLRIFRAGERKLKLCFLWWQRVTQCSTSVLQPLTANVCAAGKFVWEKNSCPCHTTHCHTRPHTTHHTRTRPDHMASQWNLTTLLLPNDVGISYHYMVCLAIQLLNAKLIAWSSSKNSWNIFKGVFSRTDSSNWCAK